MLTVTKPDARHTRTGQQGLHRSLDDDVIQVGEAFYLMETGHLAAFSVILSKATDQPDHEDDLIELNRVKNSAGAEILQGLHQDQYPVYHPSECRRSQIPGYLKKCVSFPITATAKQLSRYAEAARQQPGHDVPYDPSLLLVQRSDFLTTLLIEHAFNHHLPTKVYVSVLEDYSVEPQPTHSHFPWQLQMLTTGQP